MILIWISSETEVIRSLVLLNGKTGIWTHKDNMGETKPIQQKKVISLLLEATKFEFDS